jgi:hypothetical protein
MLQPMNSADKLWVNLLTSSAGGFMPGMAIRVFGPGEDAAALRVAAGSGVAAWAWPKS